MAIAADVGDNSNGIARPGHPNRWGFPSMRSLSAQVGIVIASLALSWVLKKFFNVNAFLLVIPLMTPFARGFNRKDRPDD